MTNDNEKRICSICGEEYEGFDNNAWPINDGRCCDACNGNLVIPARMNGVKDEKEAYPWLLKIVAKSLKGC